MPSSRSSFASRSMMLKKMENNVGARMHPCLTPLEMGKLCDRDPLCFTWPHWPSWSSWRMMRNFGVQPRRASIFHSLTRLTVSKALVRSMKTAYRPMFCSLHFSCICLSTKTMSIAIHATFTARDFFHTYFYPSGPFTCIIPKTSSDFFMCWLWLTPVPLQARRIK